MTFLHLFNTVKFYRPISNRVWYTKEFYVYTWITKLWFSFLSASSCEAKLWYLDWRLLNSFSTCFDFDRARLFWNHIAICRGCSPSRLARCCFRCNSGLDSDSNVVSSDLIWSSLNLFLPEFFLDLLVVPLDIIFHSHPIS